MKSLVNFIFKTKKVGINIPKHIHLMPLLLILLFSPTTTNNCDCMRMRWILLFKQQQKNH